MALPRAVPRCIWMASIAATSAGRSLVARCATWAVPAKVTSPTSMRRGTSARKALAASWAAAMRVGFTSVTRMLSDTSMASRIVVRAPGSVTVATGRASASSSTASASMTSAGGTCRRHEGPAAARTTSSVGRRTGAIVRRRSSHRYSATSAGSASIHHRFRGHRNCIGSTGCGPYAHRAHWRGRVTTRQMDCGPWATLAHGCPQSQQAAGVADRTGATRNPRLREGHPCAACSCQSLQRPLQRPAPVRPRSAAQPSADRVHHRANACQPQSLERVDARSLQARDDRRADAGLCEQPAPLLFREPLHAARDRRCPPLPQRRPRRHPGARAADRHRIAARIMARR